MTTSCVPVFLREVFLAVAAVQINAAKADPELPVCLRSIATETHGAALGAAHAHGTGMAPLAASVPPMPATARRTSRIIPLALGRPPVE